MAEKTKAAAAVLVNWPDMTKWTSGWAPLAQAQRLAVGNWMKANEAMLSGALALSKEMSEFAQARLREDLGIYERLAKCQNPSQAAECQREFAKTATAQYLDHANKLAGFMTKLAAAAFTLPRPAATNAGGASQKKTK